MLTGAGILFVTSLPVCLEAGAGLPGFIISNFFIGIGSVQLSLR